MQAAEHADLQRDRDISKFDQQEFHIVGRSIKVLVKKVNEDFVLFSNFFFDSVSNYYFYGCLNFCVGGAQLKKKFER